MVGRGLQPRESQQQLAALVSCFSLARSQLYIRSADRECRGIPEANRPP